MAGHIFDEAAYERGRQAAIKHNARKGRRKRFTESEPELAAQLEELWSPRLKPCCESPQIVDVDYSHECANCGQTGGTMDWQKDGSHLDLTHFTAKEREQLLRRMGWLRDSWDEWGGLTDNQTAKAKEIISEVRATVSKWDEREAERMANATPWENGRQEFPCTVVSLKLKDVPKFSYYDSGKAWKMIVQNESGARLYCTAPRKLMDAIFARADTEGDEDKIGRAARGTELVLRVNVERADNDPIFAFGKRPHIVEVKDA